MKNNIKFTIVTLLLLGVVVIFGVKIFDHGNSMQETAAVKDVYYCPMHPNYTSDHPGNCGICGMKLVKKENPAQKSAAAVSEETVQGYSDVSIDPQKKQMIGVRTALVVKKSLVKTIHTYGNIAHDLELYDAQLEYIDAWRNYYAFVTRRVVKDEYKTDWRQYYLNPPAQGRWRSDEKVKAQQRLVKADYELVHMGITESELEQLRKIKYGQPWVRPDLLYSGENQPYWVYAQVFESDLGFVAPGQKVIVTIPAYNETTEGIVRSIVPEIDPVTRTARVRIELPNYKSDLSVNMFVNVDMPVELDSSLIVPREAVMDTGLRKIVFVEVQKGQYEPRNIQIGFEADGMVAVKSGLKENDLIVVSGNFLIDSESRIKAALDGMTSEGGHQHGQ